MRMDAVQFERALATHQRMVFSIALHSLRDRTLAEDVTQDVFMALLQHGAEVDSDEHLVYWLRRVTTRRCIDQLRRQRWRRWLPLMESDAVEVATQNASGSDPLLSGRLERTLRGLAPIERVALVLRYQEDLDAAEIGKVLGLSSDAVNKHLRRALAQMKVRLSGAARPQSAQAACRPQD